MSPRVRYGVIGGLGAIALGWWCWPSPATRPTSTAVGATYELTLDQRQTTHLDLGGGDGPAIEATVAVRGQLALGPIVREPDGWVRTLAVVRLDQWQLGLGDTDLTAATREAAIGAAARIVVDANGGMIGLDVDPAQPIVVQNLLRLIASEVQFERRDRAAWTSTEPAHAGLAEVSYQRTADAPLALRKLRTGYRTSRLTADPRTPTTTDGVTTLALAADGALDRLDARERVVAGRGATPAAVVTTALTLRRTAGHTAIASRRWHRVAADAPLVDPAVDARALRMQIGDMTADRLLARIDAFTTAQGDQSFPGFVWQATGLLTAEPGLTDRLVARVRDGALTAAQRGLIVDLLVMTGHGAAQAHLRALWGEPHRFTEPGELEWLAARLGNLAAPEAATIAALLASFDDAAAPRASTRLAAGALVAVARGNAAPVADRVVARLRDDLESADTSAARVHALRALHNAGRSDTLDLIARSAADADPAVRAAAAVAVAKLSADDAVPLLTPLVRDPAVAVQRAALSTLVHQPVDDATVEHISAAILDGAIAPRAWPDAVNLIRVAPPARRAELVAFMAPRTRDVRLRGRLLGLLAHD